MLLTSLQKIRSLKFFALQNQENYGKLSLVAQVYFMFYGLVLIVTLWMAIANVLSNFLL
jgi:hypothetical protein